MFAELLANLTALGLLLLVFAVLFIVHVVKVKKEEAQAIDGLDYFTDEKLAADYYWD